MSVKALEELRKLGIKVKESCFTGVNCDAVLSLADEIENELSDNYVRLPVDINGVSWHIGDIVDGHGEIGAMCLDQYGWHFQGITAIKPDVYAHAWREPLESVLCEMIHEYGSTDKLTETVAAEYADKIRDLLGARER